jgi:hypothetical protein
MRRLLVLLVAAPLGGCALFGLVPMKHANDGLRDPHRVGRPTVDRCAVQPDAYLQQICRRERDDVLVFIRKLMVDDQICLEGNRITDGITSACRVRAFVEDVGLETIKLEIRDSPPGSDFRIMDDYWFHEEALADWDLETAGFELPR